MPYKTYKRTARRTVRYARRGAMNRYVPRNRKGKRSVNIGKLASDLYKIKRSLNTEHKFIDSKIQLNPTASVPVIQQLTSPNAQGVENGMRVGSQVRLTNMSIKGSVIKYNQENVHASTKINFYIIFVKNAEFVPTAIDIWNKDQFGQFGPLTMWNKKRYNDWMAVYKYTTTIRDLIPLDASPTTKQEINRTYFEVNKPISILQEWEVDTDTKVQTRMMPYALIQSDATSDASGNDYCQICANIRLTYVDN